MNNLSDDQKKQVAGQCSFMLVSLCCTGAFICSMYSTSFCDFVDRSVQFQDGFDVGTACSSLSNSTETAVCESLIGQQSVGFYFWYGTVPVNRQVCLPYTLFIPGLGYVTPSFDTKFNSARACGITGTFFGAMAWFSLMFSSCCPMSQQRLKGLSIYFFIATLFQGLSLLMFKSSACEPGFFSVYFPDADVSSVVADVSCSLGTGANMAVAATVLYFVCMCLIPGAVAPSPIGYSRAAAGDVEGGAAAPAAEKKNEEVQEVIMCQPGEVREVL